MHPTPRSLTEDSALQPSNPTNREEPKDFSSTSTATTSTPTDATNHNKKRTSRKKPPKAPSRAKGKQKATEPPSPLSASSSTTEADASLAAELQAFQALIAPLSSDSLAALEKFMTGLIEEVKQGMDDILQNGDRAATGVELARLRLVEGMEAIVLEDRVEGVGSGDGDGDGDGEWVDEEGEVEGARGGEAGVVATSITEALMRALSPDDKLVLERLDLRTRQRGDRGGYEFPKGFGRK